MATNMFDLTGKVAIVTGSNTGIGQGIAIGLAEAGADIAAVHRSDNSETEAAIRALGREILSIKADLSKMESVNAVVDAAMQKFGRIDILVNNAGIIRREDAINFTEKDWDDVINVNLKILFFLSQAVARQMIKQGGGKIINIASLLSFQGGIRIPSYTASKSGVRGLTMLLSNEWAKYNIQVNAIAPGYIETNNTAMLRADAKRFKEITDRIPAGRWGKPEDIAGTAIYLASRASDYVNGFTIAVDGGWLGR
ncbi:MAG: 2-dehydro-3-deoxy-D-gluconate 5-dehydrogenase KduD [Bacillota bacterium]